MNCQREGLFVIFVCVCVLSRSSELSRNARFSFTNSYTVKSENVNFLRVRTKRANQYLARLIFFKFLFMFVAGRIMLTQWSLNPLQTQIRVKRARFFYLPVG